MSKQALIYRAKNLGIINESKFKSMFIELSRYGERKNERTPISLDTPILLKKIIDVHIKHLGLTAKEVAENIASVYEQDFNELFGFEKPQMRVVFD